jgi:hypothetical protein
MGVHHGFAPALRGHTPVSPYQAFDLIEVGADLRVRPGQCCPCNNLTRTPSSKRLTQGGWTVICSGTSDKTSFPLAIQVKPDDVGGGGEQ